MYQQLADAPDRTIDSDSLRRLLPAHVTPKMDDALTILSYHGVIDDSDPEALSIAGTLFHDWYQKNQPAPDGEPSPLRVFVSYSHADEEFRRELETHLTSLRRQGILDDWHDRKILPGSAWGNQIDQHLEGADIILLLISADFIASQYCYEIEMQRALARHEAEEACVIPIILRFADWRDMPFAELQALPRDSKPVKSWADRDEAWTDVVQGLKQIARQLKQD